MKNCCSCRVRIADQTKITWLDISFPLTYTRYISIELKRMNSILCDNIEMKLIPLRLKSVKLIDGESERACIWRYDLKLNGMPLTTMYNTYSYSVFINFILKIHYNLLLKEEKKNKPIEFARFSLAAFV